MSNIEWTQQTWNPTVGCTPVSPGCLNCYAATMARRLEGMGKPEYAPRKRDELPGIKLAGMHRLDGVWCRCGGEVWYENTRQAGTSNARWMKYEAYCRACKACDPNGYGTLDELKNESPKFWGDHQFIRIAEVKAGRAVFTGEVRCVPERLQIPLRRRTPTVFFVDSMSDLFHEAVPFEFIDRCFAVMALCPQHTFQVLTKRPERMAEYFRRLEGHGNTNAEQWIEAGERDQLVSTARLQQIYDDHQYPLPNVWLGTSVENRAALDRINELRKCPAAVRFVSFEPLLEDLGVVGHHLRLLGHQSKPWAICGGESGPNARPFSVTAARSLRDQCKADGVPFFMKQMGSKPIARGASLAQWAEEQGWHLTQEGQDAIDDDEQRPRGVAWCPKLNSRKGSDMSEWPADLRVREMPSGVNTERNT